MSDGNPAKATWQAATELLRDEGDLSDSQTAFVRMAHPLAAVDDVFNDCRGLRVREVLDRGPCG